VESLARTKKKLGEREDRSKGEEDVDASTGPGKVKGGWPGKGKNLGFSDWVEKERR